MDKKANVMAYIRRGRKGGAAYFKDEIRKVQYVLVLHMTSAYTHFKVISKFIKNLENKGLEFEQDLGITIPVMFVKIHIPIETTKFYFNLYEMVPEFHNDFNYASGNQTFQFFRNPISNRNVYKHIEAAEMSYIQIRIIEILLKQTQFGKGEERKGIQKLQKLGVVQDYYALHTGTIQYEYWHNDDLLNDRTLLAKYWANYRVWYKEAPLDLIHKYFGTEVAFHFGWNSNYNLMMFPIALLGILLLIYNITLVWVRGVPMLEEFCSSDAIICGNCLAGKGCQMKKMREFCTEYHILKYFQTNVNCLYAIISSIWSFLIIIVWKRKEYILKTRWNLHKTEPLETIERVEFLEKADKIFVDGLVEYVLPNRQKYLRIACGATAFALIMTFIIVFDYAKLVFSLWLRRAMGIFDANIFLTEFQSYFQAVFTIGFSFVVGNLVERVARVINPRKQTNYDKLVLFMTFSLDLCNNFLPLIHTAFFKTLSYNIPCEWGWKLLRVDKCSPLPCVMYLLVQFMVLITFKVFFEKLFVILWPKFVKFVKSYIYEQLKKYPMPQYEEEYSKKNPKANLIDQKYSVVAIQFGMIFGFIYSFPLAPLCALFYNILANRREAMDLVYNTRRPVFTHKIYSTQPWYYIMDVITIFASLLNLAIVIFCGDFVEVKLYDLIVGRNESYITDMFSQFRPFEVFGRLPKQEGMEDLCYYMGRYNGPDHPQKYQLDDLYYRHLLLKFALYGFCQLVLLIIVYIINSCFPVIPFDIKKEVYVDRTNLDNKFNREFNKKLDLILEKSRAYKEEEKENENDNNNEEA